MRTTTFIKRVFSSTSQAKILILVSFILFGFLSGCQPHTVAATISYGPFGPIEITSDKAKVLIEYIATINPDSTAELSKDGSTDMAYERETWPLEIRFSPGSEILTVSVYPEVVLVDGQSKEGSFGISSYLADILRQEFLAGLNFSEAFRTCDVVKLISRDVPELELSLDDGQKETLGSIIHELEMKKPDSGYGGAPYPDYSLILDWNGISARLDSTAGVFSTLWTEGVYSHDLTWYDPDQKIWQYYLSNLPPPAPEKLHGLSKLFAATVEVKAEGGILGAPVMCYEWKAPILIRFLQKGQPSSDDPPAEEEPTTVTFVSPDNEWKVYLYENGFLFEDKYYLLDKAAMIFFTTMHAG